MGILGTETADVLAKQAAGDGSGHKEGGEESSNELLQVQRREEHRAMVGVQGGACVRG